MHAMTIKQEASRLKAKYRTDDPEEICEALQIEIRYFPMGTKPGSCKGFFLMNSRCKQITINSDLPEDIQRLILTHELGHAVLHSSPGFKSFHEIALLDSKDANEYEANVFAAEFLLDDDEVMDTLKEQQDFFCAARCMYVPPELLDFKLRILNSQGVKVNAPYIAQGRFLKRDLRKPFC